MKTWLAAAVVLTSLALGCSGEEPAGPPTPTEVIPDTPSIDYARIPTPTPRPVTTPSPSLGSVVYPLPEFREEIAIVDVDGGNRRHLLTPEDVVYDLIWLPDGRIVYSTFDRTAAERTGRSSTGRDDTVTHESAVFVATSAGESRRIYAGRAYITLSVSPSGEWLAIYEGRSLVGVPQRLTFQNLLDGRQLEYPVRAGGGRWSRADNAYYFVSDGSSVGTAAFVRVTPGRQVEQLLSQDLPMEAAIASANPDFTRFLFVSGGLYSADITDGSFTFVESTRSLRWSEWSPDGRYVAYATDVGLGPPDPPRMWLYDAQSKRSSLVQENISARSLSWMANGDILYSSPVGLFSYNLRTLQVTTLHAQESIVRSFQTADGNAILASRDQCTTACEPGPIDTLLLAGKGVQTLQPENGFSHFLQSAGGSTVYWGSSAVIRADSNGGWRLIDNVPSSIYRQIALSSDGKQLAFVRSYRGGPLAVEIDVETGEMEILDPYAPRQQVPRANAPQPFDLPANPPNCSVRTNGPHVSTSGSYAAWTNQCLGGLILIDLRTGDWAVLLQPDWCRRFQASRTEVLWLDDTHLQVRASGELC